MSTLAPIVIYTYTRIDHLIKTVDALKANYLAEESTLIIVSDGCGRKEDMDAVESIRKFILSIDGFKEVIPEFRETNYGAIKSVLEAERRLVNKYGKIISMEDDNVCSENFLDYMNQALNYYEHDEKVFSVSGYCPPVIDDNLTLKNSSDYFTYYWNLSWGFGIWKEKYNKALDIPNDYRFLVDNGTIKKVNNLGGSYIVDALKRDVKHNGDFPDAWLGIKMTYLNQYTIVPAYSKIRNIGSDGSGHHQGVLADKFEVILDDGIKRSFAFRPDSVFDEFFIKAMIKFYNGKLIGKIARYLGIYHYALIARSLWVARKASFSKKLKKM
ncbi:glycosyltransferase family protein [Pedobacter chitinilyticus]|uniref:Glycosyltransferase n=1 Tax=Pedobacter chitinilyticus TaxID=2233776 RepID=A0A3S3QEI5_9SPHI|nr:glycosyltransferase [Pedobacter chitinilyticus]RWU05462.1 glycosyltransferase [Pedobacter chitinilyticus]